MGAFDFVSGEDAMTAAREHFVITIFPYVKTLLKMKNILEAGNSGIRTWFRFALQRPFQGGYQVHFERVNGS